MTKQGCEGLGKRKMSQALTTGIALMKAKGEINTNSLLTIILMNTANISSIINTTKKECLVVVKLVSEKYTSAYQKKIRDAAKSKMYAKIYRC